MSAATSVRDARNHHVTHGDMDGAVCLLNQCALHYPHRMAKRGYSRAFKPHGDTGKRYLLDKIPAGVWTAVRTKAKREGISLRALILKLLSEWAATPPAQEK